MGLDIGIITIEYLNRPPGHAYEFAWEMAIHASEFGYMHGDGNSWGAFTQREVLQMLDEFVVSKGLNNSAREEILDWLRSLPWEGWQDDLVIDPDDNDDDDYYPVVDHDPDRDGGLIELHFNW